jgi:hypothetical protein
MLKQMETERKQINKEGFDEETKQKIQAYLEEINRKQQNISGMDMTESTSSYTCTLQANLIKRKYK